MKNKLSISILASGAFVACSMMLGSCTDGFDSRNVNPYEATDEEMNRDNLKTGAFFTQQLRGVMPVGDNLGGEYQIVEMLDADVFAGYFANIKDSYNIGTRHHDHYMIVNSWNDEPFAKAFTDVMQPWRSICNATEEGSVDRALSTVVKVFGMSRVTDKYGPIPYSKFGTAMAVPYDSQQDVYNQFFTELDEAISVLTAYVDAGNEPYMARYDYIYSGNVMKWVKFANTLRLRLAMRISNVDSNKARTEATAAINNKYGLLAAAADDAVVNQTSAFRYTNPLWEVTQSFNDMRMSATIECYMSGYNDPRLGSYFKSVTVGGQNQYRGMRNGMTSGFDAMKSVTSAANFNTDDAIPWMRAAEAYFLQAEAKLRLGVGNGEVKDLYEQGVRASFESAHASGVENYLADNTNVPLQAWVSPTNGQSVNTSSMLTNVTVAWDDNASANAKLQRIMVQKYLALYPDGMEAWSEMRRTGYPGQVSRAYSGNASVGATAVMSRLQFPSTEYTNNAANMAEAVQLLGGVDNAATRLWWDVN